MSKEEQQARSEAASLMGKKGGPARAKALSKRRRTEIARVAAESRWAEERNKKPKEAET